MHCVNRKLLGFPESTMQPVSTKFHFYFPERISKFPLGCKKKYKGRNCQIGTLFKGSYSWGLILARGCSIQFELVLMVGQTISEQLLMLVVQGRAVNDCALVMNAPPHTRGVSVGVENVDITPWPSELINIHWPVACSERDREREQVSERERKTEREIERVNSSHLSGIAI